MASFEYTYRCPGCGRDTKSHNIIAGPHEWCVESKHRDGVGDKWMVLVAIDGEDVSHMTDIKEKPKPKAKAKPKVK